MTDDIDHDPEPTIHDVLTQHPEFSEAELYEELERQLQAWRERHPEPAP